MSSILSTDQLWQESRKYSKGQELSQPDDYIFIGINHETRQELNDDSKKLCEIPFQKMKVVRPLCGRKEKPINDVISKLFD